MNRNAGFVVLFAMLVAGSRFVTRPSQGPVPASNALSQSVGPATTLTDDTTCPAFGIAAPEKELGSDGKITSLVQRYLFGHVQNKALDSESIPASVSFMVATVPDPLHTHLSLQFDRTLEALQQALQDEGFTYDSSWLPWKTQPTSFSSLNDQKTDEKETARRELCPGLVLFRKSMGGAETPVISATGPQAGKYYAPYQKGVFVFLVGETPTAGLNQAQWRHAQEWIEANARKDRPDRVLRILGPNFSGSMPSIVRAIGDLDASHTSYTSALLYAGRIRGCVSWKWLNNQLKNFKQIPVRTSDFTENDAILIDRFYQYIDQRGHALSEVAVLSEDETAYGGLPDPLANTAAETHTGEAGKVAPVSTAVEACEPGYDPANRPVHLYYPRDISAIRSAYQEQSIFSTSGTGEASSSARTVLHPQ